MLRESKEKWVEGENVIKVDGLETFFKRKIRSKDVFVEKFLRLFLKRKWSSWHVIKLDISVQLSCSLKSCVHQTNYKRKWLRINFKRCAIFFSTEMVIKMSAKLDVNWRLVLVVFKIELNFLKKNKHRRFWRPINDLKFHSIRLILILYWFRKLKPVKDLTLIFNWSS